MNKKKILVFVEWRLELNFFSRFVHGLNELGYELIFITNSLSLYLIGRKRRREIFLSRKSHLSNTDDNYLNSVEILGNLLLIEDAKILYNSVNNLCEGLIRKYEVNYVFIGNGSSTAQMAMNTVAKRFKVPTLFFENPNVSGKTFVDPKGVNAKSILFERINTLQNYNSNPNVYENFKKEYFHPSLSAKKSTKFLAVDNPFLILDHIGYWLLNLPKNQNFSCIDRLRRKFKYKSFKFDFDEVLLKDKYIFFPLQVSFDSQLLLNSDISIIEALEYSHRIAQENHLNLIVKPHPNERDVNILGRIIELKKEMDYQFSNSSSLELVKNCEMVVTINSTVGLEGLILGKKVIFLGKTFYKELTQDLLPKYICGYLLNIPYFATDDVSIEKLSEMLNRFKDLN